MAIVKFPPGEPVVTGKPFSMGLWAEIDNLVADGQCPDGWLEIETEDARLTCLIHQSSPFLAGLVEAESFSWVPLRELPDRARQLDRPSCSLTRADPVRVLLLAVHFRNRPALQGPTDLVDLAHVLSTLADAGNDAALALERGGLRTLLFLQAGTPARLYFGDPADSQGGADISEAFLAYAFNPDAPLTQIEVFKRLAIEPDPDAGRPLDSLCAESKPPPPKTLQVRMGDRLVMQRPFMPPSMTIGRDPTCELILDNLSVSRQHARLRWERGRFILEDLGSANGTTVNGQRVESAPVDTDDRFSLGKFQFRLIDPPEVAHPDETVLMTPNPETGAGFCAGDLFLLGNDLSMPLSGEVTIGKTRGVDVRAKGFFVKALHARIRCEGPGAYHLYCLEGASVQLNGRSVRDAWVRPGDELVIGRSRFRFVAASDEITQA